jgi:tetratricopeptide (TPR) repeat protein
MSPVACLLLVLAAQAAGGARELAIGTELHSRLAAARGPGDSPAQERFLLRPRSKIVCTLKLRSLDFTPSLLVRDTASQESVGAARQVLGDDAWWTQELAAGSVLEVLVGSADGHSGEYELSVVEGALPVPEGAALTRAVREECEALALRAELRGDWPAALAAWMQAGRIAHGTGEFEAAETDLARASELAERISAEEELLEARLLLALCASQRGDAGASLAALEALAPPLEARAQVLAGTPAEPRAEYLLALLHDSLGDLLRVRSGWPAAAAHYRLAVQAADRTGSPQLQVPSWTKLSFALEQLGASEEADGALELCQSILAAVPPTADPAESQALDCLRAELLLARARIEAQRGRSELARTHAHQALPLESRPALRAELLGTLANTCIDSARYEEASALLEQVRGLMVTQELTYMEAARHKALGVLAWHLHDLPEARRELELALASASERGELESATETRLDLALVLDELDEGAAAEELLDCAIDESARAGNAALQSRAWIDRGSLHDVCGDLDQATRAYAEALRLASASADAPLAALAEGNLGFVAWLRGDAHSARQLSTSAAARLEALGLREEALEMHDTLARMALAAGDARALRAEVDCARALLDGLGRQSLQPLQRAWHRSRFAEWGAYEQSLVELSLDCEAARGAGAAALVEQGFGASCDWKGRVLLEGLTARRAQPERRGTSLLEQVRACLPPRAALLDYFESGDRLGLYLLQASGSERIELAELAPVAREAAQLVDLFADDNPDAEKLLATSATLWTRVLAPVLQRLGPGIDTLVIVPSPALARVPFEALVSDARWGSSPVCAEPRCVIDDFLVCYLPAADVLSALADLGPRRSPERHLILADAIYGGENTLAGAEAARLAPEKELARLGRLLGSRDEALVLARMLLLRGEESLASGIQERNQDIPASCFDLYLGACASGEVFDRDLRPYSEIHLALHARADPRDPRRSLLMLSGSGQRSGVLTLGEVLDSQLDADLVVLSTCSSARGPLVRGEGVQSLAYAFMSAGARSVISTLWDVPDPESARIMLGFEVLRREPDPRNLEREGTWRQPCTLARGLVPLPAAEALRAARQVLRA